jgi:hypothetical protein
MSTCLATTTNYRTAGGSPYLLFTMASQIRSPDSPVATDSPGIPQEEVHTSLDLFLGHQTLKQQKLR